MSRNRVFTRADLITFAPRHDALVGIDSDGCVFPTMEIKQKQCMHKLIVSHWKLEPIEAYVRESAEFVNLYSKHRGQNRFAALLMSIDLIRSRPEVMASGIKLPAFTSLKKFVESGLPLGQPALEKLAVETGDGELAAVLKWSEDVNAEIARKVKAVAPFREARPGLDLISRQADVICVSQTPSEALEREWREHDLTGYVRALAGQELGAKADHLRMASQGRYRPGRILMIGDAPGDLSAAQSVRGHFFPINPGQEEASWRLLQREAFARFLNGTYGGAYETALIAEFDRRLPGTPPWLKK